MSWLGFSLGNFFELSWCYRHDACDPTASKRTINFSFAFQKMASCNYLNGRCLEAARPLHQLDVSSCEKNVLESSSNSDQTQENLRHHPLNHDSWVIKLTKVNLEPQLIEFSCSRFLCQEDLGDLRLLEDEDSSSIRLIKDSFLLIFVCLYVLFVIDHNRIQDEIMFLRLWVRLKEWPRNLEIKSLTGNLKNSPNHNL